MHDRGSPERQSSPLHSIKGDAFAAIFASPGMGVAILTPTARFLDSNAAFTAITGYSASQLRSMDWLTVTCDADVESARTMLAALPTSPDQTGEIESRLRRNDGALVWVRASISVVRDDVGGPISIIALCHDVTRHHCTEEALRLSELELAAELSDSTLLQSISAQLIEQDDVEQLYVTLVDAAVAIMRSDFGSMQMLATTPHGVQLLLLATHGFDPDATKFWKWVRTDSPCTCSAALKSGRQTFAPDVATCEFMAGTPDQTQLLQSGILAAQSTPLRARDGRLLGMISTHWRRPHMPAERDVRLFDLLDRQAADLLDRRESEETLRRSEERHRALLSLHAGIAWVTDAQGAFVSPQRAWAGYTAQTWEQMREFGWALVFHPDDRDRVLAEWFTARDAGATYRSQARLWHAASQQYRLIARAGTAILDPDGNVREWVGTCTDVDATPLNRECDVPRSRAPRPTAD